MLPVVLGLGGDPCTWNLERMLLSLWLGVLSLRQKNTQGKSKNCFIFEVENQWKVWSSQIEESGEKSNEDFSKLWGNILPILCTTHESAAQPWEFLTPTQPCDASNTGVSLLEWKTFLNFSSKSNFFYKNMSPLTCHQASSTLHTHVDKPDMNIWHLIFVLSIYVNKVKAKWLHSDTYTIPYQIYL